MPMGRGFNLWELVSLWRQVRKIWPAFRQELRDKAQTAKDARGGGAAAGGMRNAPPVRQLRFGGFSRCWISVAPEYQGIFSDPVATLSPNTSRRQRSVSPSRATMARKKL